MKKIAIIADWMTTMGGAEKVLECWSRLFPTAEFFTSVYIEGAIPFAKNHTIHTTWLNTLPLKIKKRHQLLFPFLPSAMETLDLRGFDVVISSSTFVAKAVITDETAIHICYCHTPTRYFWDEWQYFLREGLNIPSWLNPFKRFFPPLFTSLRPWDFISAQRPDIYFGNSEYVVSRIKKYYRRDAFLLRPPVEYTRFVKGLEAEKKDFYITYGRIIPYKKFDLLVQAFLQTPHRTLKIGGKGPELDKLKEMANGAENIHFLGFVPDEELVQLLGSARAFLFPQNEDAGIAPMEALCTGTPCIALQKGGALGMVNEENGVFFSEQTIESLLKGIDEFEQKESEFTIRREKIAHQMEQFSVEKYEKKFYEEIEKIVKNSSVL